MDLASVSASTLSLRQPVPPGAPKNPWVLVADGFHRYGGMDRANVALAEYLCSIGVPIHLVSFRIDPELAAHPAVTSHLVAKLTRSNLMNSWHLDRRGRQIASAVVNRHPRARVLVNGGNCDWPDLNWVHFVHRAWEGQVSNAPFWYKVKNAVGHWIDCRRERRVLRRAHTLLANSHRTKRDLVDLFGIDPSHIHTVYLGNGDDWQKITPERRANVRAHYGISAECALIIFVGAMGYDMRKGFDTLWAAWRSLSANQSWDAQLFVAGGGRALHSWRRKIDGSGLGARVRLLGFADNVPDLLAAADLLVSPVRYESYGLNVQEALCCGVPSIVSADAGVAEQYPPELDDLLLLNPDDSHELTARINNWRSRIDEIKRLTMPVAQRLRAYTWNDMAAQIVYVVNGFGV